MRWLSNPYRKNDMYIFLYSSTCTRRSKKEEIVWNEINYKFKRFFQSKWKKKFWIFFSVSNYNLEYHMVIKIVYDDK